ncbi:DUF2062 domain-containing protein [Novosphingobium sp. 9]|uniref:DUF2062 domain-containing protein n=1 Tax=Novosphingobium sp. 9 TaxID=2025349 RepID=UPI0021B6D663|nr:DUF2062 domain-containing protein [Novosphingobium sp. 9]
MSTLSQRLMAWAHRQMPTHEQLAANRFTAPLARRPALFRFTRRSVPRGVAVGMFVGIFALIPGVQIVGSALMCVPFRANIPIAAAVTFISNPLTTLLIILPVAVAIGNAFGFHADVDTVRMMVKEGAGVDVWWRWLWSDTAPAIVLGLLIESLVATFVSYFAAAVGWRLWIAHKLRHRAALHAQRDAA